VGELGVLCFVDAGGGDAEGEDAGVEAGELRLDVGVVEEVGVDELAEFGVLLVGGGADDGEDLVDFGVEEALAENTLAYHACCSEEDYIHGVMLQRGDVCKSADYSQSKEIAVPSMLNSKGVLSDQHPRLLIFAIVVFCCNAIAARAEVSARDILQHFYRAAGGRAWLRFEECDSAGTVTLAQKTGTIRYLENLHSGGNRADIEISALDIKQADGNDPMQNWHQDSAGDIQLSGPDDPVSIDDRYLTRRGYWRPDLGGAAVTVLAPQTQGSITWDLLQIKVPGGKGFTLWINRKTGLLERVEGSITKQLSDYRSVDGVLLPFIEKKPAGNGELTVAYTTRTLRKHLDNTAFDVPFRSDYQMPPPGVFTVPAEGGLIFQATINGKGPFKALFDTGSVNFMSESVAHRLGLKIDTQGIEFGTSSPATIQAHKIHVDTLQIGDLAVHDQTFYAADLPEDGDPPAFVVGYELLRRFAVRIDYEHESLTFYDGPSFHYSGSGTGVPLEIQRNGNGVFVEASIGKAAGRFIVDTGNEFGFSLTTGFTEKNDLVHVLGAHFLGYDGRGFGGPSPEAYVVRVNTLRIGDISAPSVIGHLTTDPSDKSELAGNIGQSVLRKFTEVFDCMHGQIFFERTKDSDRPEVFNGAGLIFDSFGRGLQVMTVLPGSPGALAGLKTGDVITAIDGKAPSDEVNSPPFLQPPGTELHLTVQRGSEIREVNLTLKTIM
jgi:Aspartyl protease/PDZ domain